MISCIRGQLLVKDIDSIVVEAGGIGYKIFMSALSLSRLSSVGSEITVLTHLQVREDALVLYGFLSNEEKHLFEKLITVSGVGPKAALSLLSTSDVDGFIEAVCNQDIQFIQRAPGIGKKTASRIVLELKDKFEGPSVAGEAIKNSLFAKDAVTEALLSMGFTSSESELALRGVDESLNEAAMLQYALKRLGE